MPPLTGLMLPFLKRSQDASASAPVETKERTPDEPKEYDALHSAAEDILSAIKSNDPALLAEALRAALTLCDDDQEPT